MTYMKRESSEKILRKFFFTKFILNRKGVNEANVYTYLKMKDNFAG